MNIVSRKKQIYAIRRSKRLQRTLDIRALIHAKLKRLELKRIVSRAFKSIELANRNANDILRALEGIKRREESRAFRIKQNKRLVETYADWWLGKLCRPKGHALPFRFVTHIQVIHHSVFVTYDTGASHRVNEPGGYSSLPGQHAMEIKIEKAITDKS